MRNYGFEEVITERIRCLDSSSIESRYHFISCLNEASQNFQPAMIAIANEVFVILPFIETLIRTFDDQLKTDLSPAQKNEVSHQLHCCLQAAIFCTKNCMSLLHERYKCNLNLGAALRDLSVKCHELIDHPDLPMDTKNVCSILIVTQSKISNSTEYLKWIRSAESTYVKKLSFAYGIITTMEQDCLDYKVLAEVAITLKNIYLETSVDPTLLMSVCRSFEQLTKRLKFNYMFEKEFDTISSAGLSFAFLNVEHHMDSVRHLAREILKNLVETIDKFRGLTRFLNIIEQIILLPINLRCIITVSLCSVLKAEKALTMQSDLFEKILDSISENKVTNQDLINCYEVVAKKLLEEMEFEKWFKKIVQPAINDMMNRIKLSEERMTIENLLLKLMKKENKVLEEMLNRRDTFDIDFLLMILSAGKKAGRFDKEISTDEQWKGIISYEQIRNAMIDVEDKVRNSAFLLIVEARKSTEGFTEQEIECVFHFLKYNINVSSSRQEILGRLKNLFARVQTVLQASTKKKEEITLEFYFKFLVRLQEFSLENLFEGANITRRTLSLLILHYITEILAQTFPDKAANIWDQQKFDVLMDVLNDSYEANKHKVIEIFKFIPKHTVQQFCKINTTELEVAVTSIRPPDSLTAIYLMEIITKFTFNFEEFPGEQSEKSPETLSMMVWCENLLIKGLNLAERSLTIASSTNPLYGLVQSIRHLLLKLDLKSLEGCQMWRDFFKRLIIICKRLTMVVAPVVNNSSPEGILPDEDFNDLDEQTKEEWSKIALQTTPQMVLLCSWRTVKEVSLLLGDICLRAPLISEGNGLLEASQIIAIGDHFLELLSKTKHRGAFEQCFFGFSQLCLRLWTCDEPELHKLPSAMLNQMISSISGQERDSSELLSMENLCATRRSAGLPFMIQALITSELKVSSNKNFHFVMKSLIQFCQHAEQLETRTHSLNILRALFRCSDLNESIGEYVSDGIKCAILGYGADSWVEKNSSTLLFAALMVRIFGVQRTKDSEDLDIKNKMRARIFFLRYPDLYDFFMTQLKEAAQYVLNVRTNSKLQPILLLLIRLFPSALEGTQTKLELVNFVPVVSLCSGCVELPTRVLCAKFIANVTPPHLLTARALETIKILTESNRIPANAAHGILLQILHLVKLTPMVPLHQDEKISQFTPILDEICQISDRFKHQLICFGTFVDTVIEVCLKCWLALRMPEGELSFRGTSNWSEYLNETEFSEETKRSLLTIMKTFSFKGKTNLNALISPQHSRQSENDYQKFIRYLETCFDYDTSATHHIGSSILLPKIFLVKLMIASLFGPSEFFNSLVSQSSTENDFHLKLNVILLLLDFDYAVSMQDEYEINSNVIYVIKHMCKRRKFNLKEAIMFDEQFKARLLIRSKDYQVMIKSFDTLSLMGYPDDKCDSKRAESFINLSLNKPEQLKKSILKLANTYIKTQNCVGHLDFKFLPELSTDSSYYVK